MMRENQIEKKGSGSSVIIFLNTSCVQHLSPHQSVKENMVPATHPSALTSGCIAAVDRTSRQSTSIIFLDLGSRLLSQGKNDEAMVMFDVAFHVMSSPMDSFSAQLQWGEQQLVHKSNVVIQSPVDTYHEDECDVGPRPFSTALVPGKSTDFDMLQLIICYNKALVHHARNEFALALQLYNVITGTTTAALANNSPSTQLFQIAMRAYNNMGQISYSERAEEAALLQFETALIFARRSNDSSDNHSLDCATVLSNCCRVQWMMGDVSSDVYEALEEVLRVRFSVLGWDHVDVASAHFNLGMAEYSRQCTDKAMSHLMQYLQVASHRLKANMKPELDPIPGLIFVLLIKNDDKEEKMSQDLVWGLRTLQDKRHELGPHNTEVASVLNFIGTLLFHQRELDHALLFFQEELRLEEQLIDCDDDVSVSVTCNNIGRILQELGRFPQAIYYYQRSLKHKFGDAVAELEGCKGLAKIDSSNSVFPDACDDCEDRPATMNLYSTVWYNLGLIHDKMGAYTDAIKAFQMSLKLRRAMLGRDHADVACLLYNIGVLQMEQQLLNEATDSFREALRIRRVDATGQLNDRHVVKTLQKLASLHKSNGNIPGALEACKEVVHILKISVDFQWACRNKNMGTTLRDIAELHHAQGNLDMALETAQESASLLRSCRDDGCKSSDHLSSVEQETAALLLIGSLLHERCEPMEAHRTFAEAARFIQTNVIATTSFASATTSSSLLPLLEVSTMLASAHCAPEA
jgi:tetratricopeptide (TPR) repeat protein